LSHDKTDQNKSPELDDIRFLNGPAAFVTILHRFLDRHGPYTAT